MNTKHSPSRFRVLEFGVGILSGILISGGVAVASTVISTNVTTGTLDTSTGWIKSSGDTLGYVSPTYFNTVFGLNAGGTAATSSILYESAFGWGALSLNSGSNNTAMGYTALSSNTSGADNSAFGESAMGSNIMGNENTAVGRIALWANTYGSHNTAVGAGAVSTNTTGSSNVGVGENALSNNTTGGGNTGIGGSGALFSNTTGSSNAAVGLNALYSNTTGYRSSALGESALYNSRGDYNIGIGFKSGYEITSGFDNIIIGPTQETGGNHLTTGTNNLCIGFNCILPSGTGANNELNIENYIFGKNLTATSSATTIPSTLTGSIGIGSSTPVANFQVANGSATTTMELGSSGQSKGSCLKLYRTDGSAIYAYVAAGATSFTLTTSACATVTNF